MLEVRNLEHQYSDRVVLSLEHVVFPAASITALVGPNGSGKSTLLRVLAFLETPGRGTIELAGVPITTAKARRSARRDVTLVEQQPYLFRGTVRANMLFGLNARGRSGPEAEDRIMQAVTRLHVENLLERDAGSLSDGEVQKIAVARALALRPRVLLLDEPASAADRVSSNHLYRVLEDECRAGLTVCFASHQLEDAYRWSDRFIALADGRSSPVTLENVFRVVLPAGEGAKSVQVGNLTIYVVTDTEGPATIAIPPDDLIVSTAPFPSSARNQFPGRVKSISDAGRGRVTLTVDAGIDLVGRITPAALEELGLALGAPVTLSVKAMAVRVF